MVSAPYLDFMKYEVESILIGRISLIIIGMFTLFVFHREMLKL